MLKKAMNMKYFMDCYSSNNCRVQFTKNKNIDCLICLGLNIIRNGAHKILYYSQFYF